MHQKKKEKGKNSIDKIRLLTVNIRGTNSKVESLRSAILTYQPDIVCIQESMLDQTRTPIIEGYKWAIKQRQNKQGGGVAILINNNIQQITRMKQEEPDNEEEIQWLTIKTKKEKITIGNFYGPQESEQRQIIKNTYRNLRTQIIKAKEEGPVILTGDFNAKLNIVKEGKTVQTMSRNGRIMQNEIIRGAGMHPASINPSRGTWTRQNRKNPMEKSIIDYILISTKHKDTIQNIEIDEEGTLRMKGKNETDHNTITATIETQCINQTIKKKQRKINNKEGWTKFNHKMENMRNNKELEIDKPEQYDSIMGKITTTMKKCLGEYTISNNNKPKENEKIKEKRKIMKEKRKQFNKTCKIDNNEEKVLKLRAYTNAQKELRTAIEDNEQTQVKTTMEKIIKEGGAKGDSFWKIRKKIMKSNNQYEYDLITEDNKEIIEPEEAKEYIAGYFEDLYQAREGENKYEEWTNKIKKKTNELRHEQTGPRQPITTEEIERIIKKLKRNKAMGPDEIPNEIFIEANQTTREILTQILNTIHLGKNIPDTWRKGVITRLYKGKGKKGKCSNERGITVSSNIGKIYERIIDNRARPQVKISEAQAGGREGRATTDHLIILKESITDQKKEEKTNIYSVP